MDDDLLITTDVIEPCCFEIVVDEPFDLQTHARDLQADHVAMESVFVPYGHCEVV